MTSLVRLLPVLSVAVLLLVGSCSAQDFEDWIKLVQKLGESIQFNCTDAGVNPRGNDTADSYDINSWMLPSLDRVGLGMNSSTVHVSEDGFSMTIDGVQKEQFGVYHCVRVDKSSGQWNLVKWGLNMQGPYFEDLWQKYQLNVIIGLSASGGFVILVVLVMLIYTFRWQPPVSDDLTTNTIDAFPTGNEPNYTSSLEYSQPDYLTTNTFPRNQPGMEKAGETEYTSGKSTAATITGLPVMAAVNSAMWPHGIPSTEHRKHSPPPKPLPDYPQGHINHAATITWDDDCMASTAL